MCKHFACLFACLWCCIALGQRQGFAYTATPPAIIDINLATPVELKYPLHIVKLPVTDKPVLAVYPTLTMRLGDPYTGEATYEVELPLQGNYRIWALINCPDSCHNSFWLEHGRKKSILGNDNRYRQWYWSEGPNWKFIKGQTRLSIKAREANVLCAAIRLIPESISDKPVDLPLDLRQESGWSYFRLARQLTLLALLTNAPTSQTHYPSQLIFPFEVEPGLPSEQLAYFLSLAPVDYEMSLAYARCLMADGQPAALKLLVERVIDHPHLFELKHLLAQAYLEAHDFSAAREVYIDIIATGQGVCDLNDAFEELAAIDLTLAGNAEDGLNQANKIKHSHTIIQRATANRKQGNLFGYTVLLNKAHVVSSQDVNNTMFLLEMYYLIQDTRRLAPICRFLSSQRSQDKGLEALLIEN